MTGKYFVGIYPVRYSQLPALSRARSASYPRSVNLLGNLSMTETALEQHMAVIGRVTAKFVSNGLLAHNIDSRAVEKFLGTPENKQVFEAVLAWMLDEGIIRAKKVSQTMDGTMFLAGTQLTAKGLAIVKQPLPDGETIEKRVQSDSGGDSFWSKIGDLVGSAAGSFTKSITSG